MTYVIGCSSVCLTHLSGCLPEEDTDPVSTFCNKDIQQVTGSFLQQIGLKYEEGTKEIMHFELSFLWCWNLDTKENR
jgi:hypothetical protein